MARKRPNITSQRASQRSKKAWQTRRRKYGRKIKDPQTKKNAGMVAGGAIVLGNRRLHNAYTNTKYQHTWTRPTGEKINVKGFSPHMEKHAKGAFDALDTKLKPGVKVGVSDIKAKRYAGPFKKSVGGLFIPGKEASKTAVKSMYVNGEPPKAMRALHKVQLKALGQKDESMIMVNRGHMKKGYNKPGMTERISKGKVQDIRFDPAGTLVHEVGHAVDNARGKTYGHLDETGDFNKAFGWQETTGSSTGERKFSTKSSYKGRGYQASQPMEDFAESFRAQVGTPIATKHATAMPDHFKPVSTPGRTKYMNDKFIDPLAKPVTANFTKKQGMHNHIDKFLMGGAVVGAAAGTAYGVHKYKTDRNFKHKVDTKVYNTKIKVHNTKRKLRM